MHFKTCGLLFTCINKDVSLARTGAGDMFSYRCVDGLRIQFARQYFHCSGKNNFFMGKDKRGKSPWVRPKYRSAAAKKVKRRNNNDIFTVRPKGNCRTSLVFSLAVAICGICVLTCSGLVSPQAVLSVVTLQLSA